MLSADSDSRDWSTYASATVGPTRNEPESGASSPTIMRNSVVLPAPLGPMTPTMAAGGSENVSTSISSRSPYPFCNPSASTTTSPSRGPGGIMISRLSCPSGAEDASARSCS